jgi:hypothetical protein
MQAMAWRWMSLSLDDWAPDNQKPDLADCRRISAIAPWRRSFGFLGKPRDVSKSRRPGIGADVTNLLRSQRGQRNEAPQQHFSEKHRYGDRNSED